MHDSPGSCSWVHPARHASDAGVGLWKPTTQVEASDAGRGDHTDPLFFDDATEGWNFNRCARVHAAPCTALGATT